MIGKQGQDEIVSILINLDLSGVKSLLRALLNWDARHDCIRDIGPIRGLQKSVLFL
ncbi:hypothetical protein [Caulobacter vibrioides]|uniref:hypothetical protein n=1 Tax=Caulobacter vibrioides TaxID=155892 RepID=UPI0015E70516|nr:hypothetical protein [Caulobacter vibrioides]